MNENGRRREKIKKKEWEGEDALLSRLALLMIIVQHAKYLYIRWCSNASNRFIQLKMTRTVRTFDATDLRLTLYWTRCRGGSR